MNTFTVTAFLGFVALFQGGGHAPAPVLPATPYNYAAPDLPAHFLTRLVRGLDNTPADNPITDHGATLGRVLFYDKKLSVDGTIACASCHKQENAFTDPNRFSTGVLGRKGDRNSMALVNLRYYRNGRAFWDERAKTLEEQALGPIENPVEMGHELGKALEALKAQDHYGPLFARAFGDPEINADRLAKALAQFVRSLVSYQSRYDEGIAQSRSIFEDFPNFTAEENRGKTIFLGEHDRASRGNCATCHLRDFAFFERRDQAKQTAIFFIDQARNNGLEAKLVSDDNGIGDHSLNAGDYGRFKSSSLRNVEVTGPYMHDGRFQTLEEVVTFYNESVQPHPNLDPQLFGGPGRGRVRLMGLDEADKKALVAFLKTLTDRKFLTDPKFSDPFPSERGASTDVRRIGAAP